MTSNQTQHPAPWSASTLLWCSAFILLGLVIVQAGRLGTSLLGSARADVVSRVGDYSILTTAAQSSEDLAVVLDGRGEQLFVYRIVNQKQLELIRKYEVGSLFSTGQRIGPGRGK